MKQKTHFGSYLSGFILSAVFVALAYALVSHHALPNAHLYLSIAALAIVQLVVYVLFYFRPTLQSDVDTDRWSMLVFILTLIIITIVISGSLWIMYNLNYYMVN